MPEPKKAKPLDFEKSLAELREIVRRMEQGEQTLEQTLKDFERGMALSEQCRRRLDVAQQRVEKLVEKHGEEQLQPLDDNDDDDEGNDRAGGGDGVRG